MFVQLFFFFFLLVSLFFLSQKIQTYIYSNVLLFTKSKKIALFIMLVILFPGTIIHELSHFLVATILRVQTGNLTVFPSVEDDGEVKAGKLYLADCDPFRLSVIGLAPILIGLILIYALGKFFSPNNFQLPTTNYQLLTAFAICYLLFAISITMFSSKKDLTGVIIAGPIILVVIISLYFVGVRVFLENNLLQKMEVILKDLNFFLLATAVLDYLVFLVLAVTFSLGKKILLK